MVTFPKPAGKPQFTAPWFRWFFPQLTLPESDEDNPQHLRWEGHLLLMTEELFRPELVHLLVIIPKGGYKTTWEGALADWHLMTVKAPRIYAGAADKEQAKELYQFAAHFAECRRWIADRLLVRESTLEIRSRVQRGLFKILASDDSKQGGKKQGKNATLGLIDELHAHENDNLYTDIISGGGKRRHNARVAGDPLWHTIGKVATITTAGWDLEGTLGKLRQEFLEIDQHGGTVERFMRTLDDGSVVHDPERGRLTICRSATGSRVMLQWASTDEDDISDSEVVKLANPATGQTVAWIDEERENLTPWNFERYHTGRWTTTYESWIPAGSWEAMEEHGSVLEPDEPTVAALDMARYRDSAALVLLQRRSDGRKVVEALTWRPGGPDDPVPYSVVKDAIRAAADTYRLQAVGVDPKWSDQLAEELFAEGIPVETFSQANERMCPAWAELRKDILEGAFVHDGDPVLRSHMYAGTIYEVGTDQFKVVKAKASGPDMDAADALAMANALANQDLTSMYEDEDARI